LGPERSLSGGEVIGIAATEHDWLRGSAPPIEHTHATLANNLNLFASDDHGRLFVNTDPELIGML